MKRVINIFSLQPRAQEICAARHFALFLLVFCLSASSNSLAATLSGTILGNGSPLDATVRVYGGSVDTSVSTDAAGNYSVSGLSINASYLLDITPAASLALKALTGYGLTMTQETQTADFNLTATYGFFTVSGYLKSDEGYAISSSMRITDDCCSYSGSSDTNGLYSITNVREGEDLTISTYADSATVKRSPVDAVLVMYGTWGQNSQTFDLSADTTLSDIVINLQYIDGKVIDSNGVGIVNATVQARGGSGYRGTSTDDQGRYGIALYSSQTVTDLIFTSSYTGLNINESISRSLNGNDQSLTLVLPFTDEAPPKFLSGPQLASVAQERATLLWSTDEPTRSVVSGTGFLSVSNGEYRVNHEVTLTGLSPSTAYTATVAITDRSGNGPVEATLSFTTPAAPDAIAIGTVTADKPEAQSTGTAHSA